MAGKSKTKTKKPNVICIVHCKQFTKSPFLDVSENKLKTIQEAQTIRLEHNEPVDCTLDIPKVINNEKHKVHEYCYRKYTNTAHIIRKQKRHLAKLEPDDQEVTPAKLRRGATDIQGNKRLFPNKCIFCSSSSPKYVQKSRFQKRWEQLTKCQTADAEIKIKEVAESKTDEKLLLQIRGENLHAREAKYHPECRRQYIREDRSTTVTTSPHDAAFSHVCEYIDLEVIKCERIVNMTDLKVKYIDYIKNGHPGQYNPAYQAKHLKTKLEGHYGDSIRYFKLNKTATLVYYKDATPKAFGNIGCSSSDIFKVAIALRKIIMEAYHTSPGLTWPPTATTLTDDDLKPPKIVFDFLSYLIAGCSWNTNSSPRSVVTVNSFAQDMCYAVTSGRWRMPKHIALSMTVRHLTGSAELVTLLNRFGHCQSYVEALNVENTLANSVIRLNQQSASVLPKPISRTQNRVVHTSFDNFDLQEETPSGAHTSHFTNGIIIQETLPKEETDKQQDPPEDQQDSTAEPTTTRKRESFKYVPIELEECYNYGRPEPNITAQDVVTSNPELIETIEYSHFMWGLARYHSSDGTQSVPGWSGWVSLSGRSPHACGPIVKKSIVQYLPPILKPITENATVLEVIKQSEKMAEEVLQPATIITMDLAAAKKANNIIWQNPERFQNVVVRYGVFHTTCAALHAVGKLLRGSGFSEIIIEAGTCASGSLEGVLTGKHYNRSVRVHKIFLESLQRNLFDKFISQLPIPMLTQEVIATLNSIGCTGDITESSVQEAMEKPEMKQMFNQFEAYKSDVRNGSLGKTAQFWLAYIEEIWLILRFIRASKENDFDLHLLCLQDLCPLFFAMDQPNYARYLTAQYVMLANLKHTNPEAERLLRDLGFSVSRSQVPASRVPVDQTIEQTINRSAKSQGGVIGFSTNPNAYYRWSITRHHRAEYAEMTMKMADMHKDETDSHKDTGRANIASSEDDVSKTRAAISNFLVPFETDDTDQLYCLSSGMPVPDDVAEDLLHARSRGKVEFDKFIGERLVSKTKSFHDPVKRMKLKTFVTTAKKATLKTSDNKLLEVRAERNIFGQLVLISQENNISLKKVLEYPLSPVPWALGSPDGLPAKTAKATLLDALEKHQHPPSKPAKDESLYIYDGNAIYHSLVQRPSTFEELAEQVFDMLPKSKRVDFITDSYQTDSIKEPERRRRGTSKAFMIKGPKTKVPKNWSEFLSNSPNKTQLSKFILQEWQKDKYSAKLKDRKVYFTCENTCTVLTSDGLNVRSYVDNNLLSTQEEGDTKMVLHAVHMSKRFDQSKTIIVRSPDTDVLVLMIHHSHRIKQNFLFDTGNTNKRRLIDAKSITTSLGQSVCLALPSLHAFTGCDSVSAFVRRGKTRPLTLLQNSQKYQDAFKCIGCSTDIKTETQSAIEEFVCSMYGKPKFISINDARYELFKEKYQPSSTAVSDYEGTDISLLPPCQESLKQHMKRTNYQAYIWKQAHIAKPVLPSPIGNGWKKNSSGELELDWCTSNILPQDLVDVMRPDVTDLEEPEPTHELQNYIDEVFTKD